MKESKFGRDSLPRKGVVGEGCKMRSWGQGLIGATAGAAHWKGPEGLMSCSPLILTMGKLRLREGGTVPSTTVCSPQRWGCTCAWGP